MINEEFFKKQIEQTKIASEILATGQKQLDDMFSGVLKEVKKTDPKKANELNKLMSKSSEIMKQAKNGDIGKIDELIKDLKNVRREG